MYVSTKFNVISFELTHWNSKHILEWTSHILSQYYQAGDTRTPLPRKSLWTLTKNCRLQSWTLYKSGNCRWISIAILCVSFTNSATVGRLELRLEQVQLCNRQIDQSADNITSLNAQKSVLSWSISISRILDIIATILLVILVGS